MPNHEHKAFVPYTSIFSESPVRRRHGKERLGLNQSGHARPDPNAALPLKRRAAGAPFDSANLKNAMANEQVSMLEAGSRANGVVTDVAELVEEKLHVFEEAAAPLEQGDARPSDDPYDQAEPHLVVCGEVKAIHADRVTIQQPIDSSQTSGLRSAKRQLWSVDTMDIPYTHLIYALGSHLPDPLRHESYTKRGGMTWMKHNRQRIDESQDIVLVGGGALGVQLATDIASYYRKVERPKNVTLIHSRQQLLPNFDPRIHDIAYDRLKDLGVNVVLGHRLATTEGCPMGSAVTSVATAPKSEPMPAPEAVEREPRTGRTWIRTTLGLELECDLLLMCTGQQPNSELMQTFSPSSVSPQSRLVRVLPSLQVMLPHGEHRLDQPFESVPPCRDCDCFLDMKAAGNELLEEKKEEDTDMPAHMHNVYAIGDVADAFGALNAGYQAWYMADVAAENILRDILRVKSSTEPEDKVPEGEAIPLEVFRPAPTLLKLTLGLNMNAIQGAPEPDESLPGQPMRPKVSTADEQEDMGVESVWKCMALADPSDMYA